MPPPLGSAPANRQRDRQTNKRRVKYNIEVNFKKSTDKNSIVTNTIISPHVMRWRSDESGSDITLRVAFYAHMRGTLQFANGACFFLLKIKSHNRSLVRSLAR